MTRLPAEAQRISYAPEDMPGYDLPFACAHPTCPERGPEAHHIVRRSYTQGKGPQDWICLDGQPVPNKVGLCQQHHMLVTENQARIVWEFNRWCWAGKTGLEPLDPVPLVTDVPDVPAPPRSGHADGERGNVRDEREESPEGDPPSRSLTSEASLPPSSPRASEVCPTCNRKIPKVRDEKVEAPRKRTRWTIAVPKDHQEDGAELLDQAIQAAALRIGYSEDTPKYFVVLRALDYVAYVASESELGEIEAA